LTQHPIKNLVIVSDLHCGCRLGLCPSDPQPLADGGLYVPSKIQKTVYGWWQEFWYEWVPRVCHGEPFAVAINGEAVDGVHHKATTGISQNMDDQRQIAKRVLEPIRDLCEGRFYMLSGTPVHSGEQGCDDETIARELGAIPDETGRHARYGLWMRVGKALVHLTHHIGTTGSQAYESTAVHKELVEAFIEAGRWHREPPDFSVRSHRHRYIKTEVPTHKGAAYSIVTPGWQGKMLDLNTQLPTPAGWTTMGDVRVGDALFDDNGLPCRVTAVLPIDLRPESFEVKFSNGESVKACADHLWVTTAEVDAPGSPYIGVKRPRTRVRTTRELYNTLVCGEDRRLNHRVAMPDPLSLQEAALPIDPYVLGCWLGDGDADSARLTCSGEDAEHFEAEFARCGYSLSPQSITTGKSPRFCIRKMSDDQLGGVAVAKSSPDNLQRQLRQIGVLGRKHIPSCYLRASINQRLSLLQGLMDTDGYAENRGRVCEFVTTLPELRDGVSELLATLGIKFTRTQKQPTLRGKQTAMAWRLRFFVSPDVLPVFRMTRKLSRLPLSSQRKAGRQRSRQVSIVSVTPCQPVPMRCIAVDSPSHLYLFGRTMLPTHNTPFVFKIPGGRQSEPQFGGIVIRQGDEEFYERSWVKSLERPTEVVL
jgi:hypothetical protein